MIDFNKMTLSEIGTLERGKGLQKSDFAENGVPCIHYGQIFTYYGGFTDSTISFVSPETAKNCTMVYPGDVILAITSENVQDLCKGTVWLGKENIVTGGHSGIFRHNQSPKFIGYYFESQFFQKQKAKYAKGTKVIEINPEDILNKIKIILPDLETQKKIVAILEKWDAAIENLKRQILEEEKVSKGLLNKTFPLYGNYNNLTKMIDVAIIEKGRALSAKQIVNGDYPVFAGGIESPYSHNDFTHENVITVSASGANAGYVAYRKGKIWASDCNVVKGDGVRTLTMFLYYWLKSRQRYIYSLQTGGAQPHVHASDIAKLQIEIPSINNQFKIINILGTQDQKLSLLRQKLSNYESQRKYLLNRLLSGKEDI